MKVSNCCGVSGSALIPTPPTQIITYEIYELCPKCEEHCEYVEETECDHKNAYFFHDNAPKYCPDCNKYIDGKTDLNTINTENEQRISKTGLPTGTSGTDKKNLSSRGNG